MTTAYVMQIAEYRMDYGPKTLKTLNVQSVPIPADENDMVEAALEVAAIAANRTEEIDAAGEFQFVGCTPGGDIVFCNNKGANDPEHSHIVIVSDTLEAHVKFQNGLRNRGWTYETNQG